MPVKAKPRQKIGGTNWLTHYADMQVNKESGLFGWGLPNCYRLLSWLLVLGRSSYFYNQEIQKSCNILYTFSGYFKNFVGLLVVFIKFLWDVLFSIFTRRCRVSENSSWSSSFAGIELFLNFSHILVTFWLIGEFYVGFVF